MLVINDLGFRVAAWVCFLGLPLLFLLIRRKWRVYAARQEEIQRLVVLAAEEAARAELEGVSIGYGVPPPLYSGPDAVLPLYSTPSSSSLHSSCEDRFCAVCGRPTKTRCARCKSVRYCSGKCQIVHWRQGHKHECHPPEASLFDDGVGIVFDASKPEQCDNSISSLHSGRRQHSKPNTNPLKEPEYYNSMHYPEQLSEKDEVDGARFASEHSSIAESCESCASFSGGGTCIDDSASDGSLHDLDASDEDCHGLASKEHVQNMQQNKSLSPKLSGVDESVNVPSSASHIKVGGTKNRSLSSENLSAEPSTLSSGFWDGSLDSSKTKRYVQHGGGRSSFLGVDDRILSESRSTLQFSFNLPVNSSSDMHSQGSKPLNGARQSFSGIYEPTSKATLPQKVPTSLSRGRASSSLVSEKLTCEDRKTKLDSRDEDSSSRKYTPARGHSASVVANVLKVNDLRSNDSGNAFRSSTEEVRPSQNSSKGLSSSSTRVHAAEAVKYAVVDKLPGTDTMPHQAAKTSANATVGLKTSMLKVVDQFRGSKLSKYYTLGVGGDNIGRSSEKGLFPYDVFVKLYNWDKMDFSPFGLVNCGNSCYANAVLQCLTFTPPLTAYFLQGLHSKACLSKDWCFSCEFERLILKAKEGSSTLSPICILSQIQRIGSHLAHGREEDAHEFLRHAVDAMQSICLREAGVSIVSSPIVEETTLVGLTFGGYIQSKIRCMKCHGKSERHERMMDLTVEIEGDIETLEEALQKFTMSEFLDGENKYQCSRCKTYEKARKKLTIVEAPNILTIALKRFQSGKFGKLNKAIRFPEILDLAPYMRGSSDKSPVYRLYGVVVHLDFMNAAFSGHYVCYVRNAQNKWFKTDDSKVKPVSLDRVLKKGAYMLFYSRCSPRAPKSIRSTLVSREAMYKSKHHPEADPSGRAASSSRSGDRSAHHTPHHIPNGHSNYDYVHQVPSRIINTREVDSSSDNSSLFSHSDEVSTSTDTRESTSADDLSDYIFGDLGNTYNGRPGGGYWVHSSDSDASSSSSSTSSPLYTRHSPLSKSERQGYVHPDGGPWSGGSLRSQDTEGRGVLPFLHSDSAKSGRKVLVNSSSSSCREADSGRVVGAPKPLDNAKSGLHLRRSSRKRD